MPSFDDWYEWAIAEGEGWEKVAANAKREARYARKEAAQEFRQSIGQRFPKTHNAYKKACFPHHLEGEEVADEHLPDYLTYMGEQGHLDQAVARIVDEWVLLRANPIRVSQTKWIRVSDLLPSREYADGRLFVLAQVIDKGKPAARAVFATFDADDKAPENHRPQPKFLQRVRELCRASETVADCAVRRLGMNDRPKPQQDQKPKVLFHYPQHRVAPSRFPVPADARWNPRFRAIRPQDNHYCGRTFPDGSDPADHANGICGENEVVHGNERIPWSEVYVISLGKTSCRES